MQDAFLQDMFNLGGINNTRNNGHIQVSSAGKGTKRDRKGCKKGKIEAIMKNNLVSSKNRIRLASPSIVKKTKQNSSLSNHVLKSGSVIKSEALEIDDPYTFTEPEPQILSLYQGANNLTLPRKVVSLPSNKSNKSSLNMVCIERGGGDTGILKTQNEQNNLPGSKSTDIPARQILAKSNKLTVSSDGSSKTMNRLQADIARSKVIVKRHKNISSRSDIKTECKGSDSYSPSFTKVSLPANRMQRQSTWQKERKLRHEALQRIEKAQHECWEIKRDLYPLGLELSDSEEDGDKEEEEDGRGVYQRHWFMSCVWGNGEGGGGGGRESRLAQVSCELRRRVRQMWRGVQKNPEPESRLVQAVIDASRRQPSESALLLNPKLKVTPKQSRSRVSMLRPQKCCLENICQRAALPCTRHCAQHIMYNVDQLLFAHCTAKFADNTQCCVPVFDITHELPLCPDHRKCDNYDKLYSEHKPKKSSRKKPKPSALTRSTKRGKKKKKPRLSPSSVLSDIEITIKSEPELSVDVVDQVLIHSSSPGSHHASEVFLTDPPQQPDIIQVEDAVEEVSEEVLAIASLDPAELASQASRLLEEHDLTNMLSQIPFSDLFTDLL
uniref:KANL2-like probable zinc-finger domain-containing protein n=1 Tax=Clastoptera arizonana TaxID=38151 RepID=A0A1B6EEY6_9HEMI